jgi:hypothetical protein
MHTEELHNLYSLSNIIRIIKSRGVKLAGHVACMGTKKQCIPAFGGKARRKQTTRKTNHSGRIILKWILEI